MPFLSTVIHGVVVYEPTVYDDSRGYFFEAYSEQTFLKEGGISLRFVQDNQSQSSYGVIRGLHYQLMPYAQSKLVRVVQGTILDVAVDIRQGSPTFGRHVAVELSAENRKQLLIPPGFAHGFSVLSDTAIVLYKCDALYNRESEAGIRYDDPELNIDWKIDKAERNVSAKDNELPSFSDCRNNFKFQG